ncbi:MAG TPA: UvrD-helicase domain-containing protein [Stellaceae bacterium]|nr:UvrD-helicase domain-containing protein [Stellaceae bacterium]
MSDFDFPSYEGAPAPVPAPEPPPPRPAPQYLGTLNDGQRQAVEALDGPVLVLAGAGTGKTRVLTTRLAHLLYMRRAFPSQMLAVTFTNKAALEMRERLEKMIGASSDGMWLGTFHSIAARILRRHAEVVGLKQNFTILDTDDQLRLAKQILQAAGFDDKAVPARSLLGAIERWKDRGLTPDKVGAKDRADLANGKAPDLYRAYQERLLEVNAADFGDLLLHNLTIFNKREDILADYQRRFRYILVDEYQDTNVSQYLWLRLLAQQHKNLCCVGDDDQSIYSWRGAEIGNILRFEKDFPGAKIVRLEQNYRSTPPILAAASGLIAKNAGRLGKTLWTSSQGGDKVVLKPLWDGIEEARWVGDEIEALQRKGQALSQIAILVRTGFQTREFEERFITMGLPYRVLGGPRFYERQEIRDALAYLRLVHQPADDLAFERIVNVPKRGLGTSTLEQIHVLARERHVPLTDAAAQLVGSDELKPAARRSLGDFLISLERWREAARSLPHTELTEVMLDESGYTGMWQADKSPDAPGRLENLKELVNAMAEFENLEGFLEHVALVMENTERGGGDMVSLMTLHGAKGLEFDMVFLPGWEEGLFPSQRSMDENGLSGLEEERRLAYVGLTRARKRAFISYAANRRIHGQWQSAMPSRFVDELPADHVELLAEPGLPTGARGGFSEFNQSDSWPRTRVMAPRSFKAPLIEGRATRVSEPIPKGSGKYQSGDRVFHQKFGYGTVGAVSDDKLSIHFDKAGNKMVIANFVTRADGDGRIG